MQTKDLNYQSIYKELRAFIEFGKNEKKVLELLSEGMSQKRLLESVEVLSDTFQFLKYDYNSLQHYVITENLIIEDIHLQHFIGELQCRELYEDSKTFVFPDYQMALFQEKIKRALNLLFKLRENLPA